jgi:hypothetical protein
MASLRPSSLVSLAPPFAAERWSISARQAPNLARSAKGKGEEEKGQEGTETKSESAEARESKRIERVAGTATAHTTDANRNTPHPATNRKKQDKKERGDEE